MKGKFVVANWKMNCNISEAKALVSEIIESYKKLKIVNCKLKIVLCPPFTALQSVSLIIRSSDYSFIHLGAQNCHFMPCGAYTGEISPKMLKDFCDFVILGHSERRKFFGETDELINKKIRTVLDVGLCPIVCIDEYKKGEKSEIIFNQVEKAIQDVKEKDLEKIIFAYEPIWAISTSADRQDCEPSYASKIIKEIKELLHNKTPVFYGGSVDVSNISAFVNEQMLDGFLVGGASLKPKSFIKIIETVGAKDVSKS